MNITLSHVAGVDEAGRGPLAGPLVCAAVILNPAYCITGLRDSKQLSAAKRDALRLEIVAHALSFAIIEIEPAEIDQRNIFGATMEGMRRAVAALGVPASMALIDGNKVPPGLCCAARAIVKGDQLEACISAASILAKTTRDARMLELAVSYPGYGFEIHKGYPTPAHLKALYALGPCSIHRQSYAPVRAAMGAIPQQSDLFALAT
jgi:ribonuclease HII